MILKINNIYLNTHTHTHTVYIFLCVAHGLLVSRKNYDDVGKSILRKRYTVTGRSLSFGLALGSDYGTYMIDTLAFMIVLRGDA